MNALEIGRLVTSLQGHDKGCAYIVVKVLSDGTVLLADGKSHPLTKPKKKNPKHLVAKPVCFSTIREKILQGAIADFEIITALNTSREKEA